MKKTKKIMIAIFLFLAIILLGNKNVFATDEDYALNAFNEFKNLKYESTYNLYVGEEISVYPTQKYHLIDWYLTPKITIDNKSIVEAHKTYGYDNLKAKKAGKSKVTVEVTFNGETVTKSFNINVKKQDTNPKLESSSNDVVSVVPNSFGKNEVLLANSELWKTDKKTFKLTSKDTGNVTKYVYSAVYADRFANNGSQMITLTLKKNKKLTVANNKQKLSYSKIKEISNYGHLTTSGKYYIYTLDKNDKLGLKKIDTGVSSLLGNYLYVKNKKTYAISGKKIFDFAAVDVDESSTSGYGLVLNSKGELYYYTLKDYDKGTYTTKKVATGVKEILGNYVYKTKSGKVKRYVNNSYDDKNDLTIKTIYLNYYNKISIKNDKKVYLNDVCIMKNVDDIYYANGSKNKSALLVRKDGSIWRLDIGGNSNLTKIRSGKESAKRLSAPKDLSTSKSGKNAKITWGKVDGSSKYTIYRATSKNGKYTKIGTSKTNSYTDKKVSVGKGYYYKVVANHSSSKYDSSKSSAVAFRVPKVPTKLKTTKKSKTSMKVSFKKVSGASGYEIQYATNKNFKKATKTTTSKTSCTIKELKSKKTYYVKVRAYKTVNGKKIYGSFTSSSRVSLK